MNVRVGVVTKFAAVGIVLAAVSAPAFARKFVVGRRHMTLERALERAKPGDRIVLKGARHRDLVLATPGVTLDGRGAVLANDVIVSAPNVTLTGFVFEGRVIVSGDAVTVRSNTLRKAVRIAGGSGVRIEDNDIPSGTIAGERAHGAEIRDNRLSRRGDGILATGDGVVVTANTGGVPVSVFGDGATVEGNAAAEVHVEGDGAVVRDNDVGADGLTVTGRDANVTSNRLVDGGIEVEGRDADVVDNRAVRIDVTGGDGAFVEGNATFEGGVHVTGSDCVVAGNDCRGTGASAVNPFSGLSVFGDRASVRGNAIDVVGTGIWVVGRENDVSANEVEVFFDSHGKPGSVPSIEVDANGPGVTVVGNTIHHTDAFAIIVRGSGVDVIDNGTTGTKSRDSVHIDGGAALVSGNTLVQSDTAASHGSGIVLLGNGNLVVDNTVTGARLDGIQAWSGNDNTIRDNVSDSAVRCGIWVHDSASGTKVDNCTSTGACVGLMNTGPNSCVTNCDFTGNGDLDVYVGEPCQLFASCTYATYSDDPGQRPSFND